MPSLPEVTQTFDANVAPYIAKLAEAQAATEALAKAAKDAGQAMVGMGISSEAASKMVDALEASETVLIGVSSQLNSILREVADAASHLGNIETSAAAQTSILKTMLGELGDISTHVAAQTSILASIESHLGDVLTQTAAKAALARLSVSVLGDTMTRTAAQSAAAAAALGVVGNWWRQWGGVVHWVVMGSLEILGTALPALVMFGAVAAAMYPTIDNLVDRFNALYIATGSLHGVLQNSVGPLAALSAHFGQLTNAVKPDVYIILGAAINTLSSSFQFLAPLVQDAANVLASFATKLSGEIQNSGSTLHRFFQDAIQDFTRWGQVIGNLAGFVIHAFSDMFGVGKVLLVVIMEITRALDLLASNPITGTLIGVAAAMSAVYRYGKLLVTIWTFLGGTAIGAAIKTIAANMITAATATGSWDAALVTLRGELGALLAEAAPLLIITAAIGEGLLIWWLRSQNVSDATTQLINKINSESPSASNLSKALTELDANMLKLGQESNSLNAAFAKDPYAAGEKSSAIFAQKQQQIRTDMANTIAEIQKEASQLINLDTGLAEAGIRSGSLGQYQRVMAVDTAIADSKVQQLNQSIDQYITLLTGGVSAVAAFATGLNQLGSVAASTSNSLTTAGGSLSLTATQFSNSLKSMNATGAAAWTNLTTLMSGSMQQTADWFRTAASIGAASSGQVNQAVLSMVGSVSKYVATSKNGQTMLLGWARANGIVASSYPALLAQVKAAGGGMGNLTKDTFAVTGAMANLSAMAKNAAAALNTEATAAIAAAALKASGFDGTVNQLNSDIAKFGPNSAQVHVDLATMGGELQNAQGIAMTYGNQVSTSQAQAAQATHTSTTKIGTDLDNSKGKFQQMEHQAQLTGSNSSSAMSRMSSSISGSLSHTDGDFQKAMSIARQYQNTLDALHSPPPIVVTTIYQTVGSPIGSPAKGFPYHGAIYGYAGGGYIGSGMGGMDRVPAMLTVGEAVLTKAATAALGGPLGIRNLNDNPHLGLGMGAGGSSGVINLTIITPVQVGGRTVNTQQRTETLIYNRRNPTNNLSLRNR